MVLNTFENTGPGVSFITDNDNYTILNPFWLQNIIISKINYILKRVTAWFHHHHLCLGKAESICLWTEKLSRRINVNSHQPQLFPAPPRGRKNENKGTETMQFKDYSWCPRKPCFWRLVWTAERNSLNHSFRQWVWNWLRRLSESWEPLRSHHVFIWLGHAVPPHRLCQYSIPRRSMSSPFYTPFHTESTPSCIKATHWDYDVISYYLLWYTVRTVLRIASP